MVGNSFDLKHLKKVILRNQGTPQIVIIQFVHKTIYKMTIVLTLKEKCIALLAQIMISLFLCFLYCPCCIDGWVPGERQKRHRKSTHWEISIALSSTDNDLFVSRGFAVFLIAKKKNTGKQYIRKSALLFAAQIGSCCCLHSCLFWLLVYQSIAKRYSFFSFLLSLDFISHATHLSPSLSYLKREQPLKQNSDQRAGIQPIFRLFAAAFQFLQREGSAGMASFPNHRFGTGPQAREFKTQTELNVQFEVPNRTEPQVRLGNLELNVFIDSLSARKTCYLCPCN
jgi:hypothetical protein